MTSSVETYTQTEEDQDDLQDWKEMSAATSATGGLHVPSGCEPAFGEAPQETRGVGASESSVSDARAPELREDDRIASALSEIKAQNFGEKQVEELPGSVTELKINERTGQFDLYFDGISATDTGEGTGYADLYAQAIPDLVNTGSSFIPDRNQDGELIGGTITVLRADGLSVETRYMRVVDEAHTPEYDYDSGEDAGGGEFAPIETIDTENPWYESDSDTDDVEDAAVAGEARQGAVEFSEPQSIEVEGAQSVETAVEVSADTSAETPAPSEVSATAIVELFRTPAPSFVETQSVRAHEEMGIVMHEPRFFEEESDLDAELSSAEPLKAVRIEPSIMAHPEIASMESLMRVASRAEIAHEFVRPLRLSEKNEAVADMQPTMIETEEILAHDTREDTAAAREIAHAAQNEIESDQAYDTIIQLEAQIEETDAAQDAEDVLGIHDAAYTAYGEIFIERISERAAHAHETARIVELDAVLCDAAQEVEKDETSAAEDAPSARVVEEARPSEIRETTADQSAEMNAQQSDAITEESPFAETDAHGALMEGIIIQLKFEDERTDEAAEIAAPVSIEAAVPDRFSADQDLDMPVEHLSYAAQRDGEEASAPSAHGALYHTSFAVPHEPAAHEVRSAEDPAAHVREPSMPMQDIVHVVQTETSHTAENNHAIEITQDSAAIKIGAETRAETVIPHTVLPDAPRAIEMPASQIQNSEHAPLKGDTAPLIYESAPQAETHIENARRDSSDAHEELAHAVQDITHASRESAAPARIEMILQDEQTQSDYAVRAGAEREHISEKESSAPQEARAGVRLARTVEEVRRQETSSRHPADARDTRTDAETLPFTASVSRETLIPLAA